MHLPPGCASLHHPPNRFQVHAPEAAPELSSHRTASFCPFIAAKCLQRVGSGPGVQTLGTKPVGGQATGMAAHPIPQLGHRSAEERVHAGGRACRQFAAPHIAVLAEGAYTEVRSTTGRDNRCDSQRVHAILRICVVVGAGCHQSLDAVHMPRPGRQVQRSAALHARGKSGDIGVVAMRAPCRGLAVQCAGTALAPADIGTVLQPGTQHSRLQLPVSAPTCASRSSRLAPSPIWAVREARSPLRAALCSANDMAAVAADRWRSRASGGLLAHCRFVRLLGGSVSSRKRHCEVLGLSGGSGHWVAK